MNSAGVRASRSCTDERRNPPVMKWTCESMNPGVTMPPLASMTLARGAPWSSFTISALDPTVEILSPDIATPEAHGCAEFPVHTRALMIARVISLAGVIDRAQPKRLADASQAKTTRVSFNSPVRER
jgi:hypothetical protein